MNSKLAAYRKAKGMTQEELAEQSGITVRTIQRIESGKVEPQLFTLRTLAGCLDIDPGQLTQNPSRANLTLVTIDKENHSQTEQAPTNKASAIIVTPAHNGLLAVIHISPLIGIYAPFINILIPVIFWLLKKQEHPAYNQQGRQIINFQITVTIATYAAIGLMLVHPAGYALLMAVYVSDIIFALMNAAKALKGKETYYPLAIPFLRRALV